MNISEAVDFILFWVNKKTGAWYTVPEAVNVIDAGQMAMYRDLKPKYAVSQWVKDALSPFRESYNFTTAVSGNVIIPDTDYLDLLDIQIYFQISNRTVYAPIKLINEDERANRLNSQVDPVTTTSPIGEQIGLRTFRLYPIGVYNGNVTYLRRPIKPVYGYTVVSGRVIVYDANTSTQLEWRETEHIPILLKGLQSLGINLSDQEIQNFSQIKTQENWQGVNRL